MKKTNMSFVLFMLLCMGSNFAFGQAKRNISGTVRDSAGVTLPGVSVVIKGSKIAGTTDAQGNFQLSIPSEGSVLVFTSVGYQPYEMAVGTADFIPIVLRGVSGQLNEVVVTAFGTRKSTKKISYAVTEVKGDDLSRANTPNLANALQGKVPGVMINQGAGGPSSSSRIRIRGNASISSGNTMPLFVIDGVLIKPGVSGADSWGDNRDFGNELKNLNPDDYESMTVLKGSAATALYGSQGLNGVILITTKKGKARKGLGVSASQSFMWENAYRGPDWQNEYGGGINPYFSSKDAQGNDQIDNNDFDPYFSFGPKLDGHTVRDADGRLVPFKGNDILSVFRTGNYSNTNVAVEGGNERTTFRFSYTHTDNKSIGPNNSFNRNVFMLRATQKLNNFVNLDAVITYANSNSINPLVQGGNSNPLFRLSYSNSRNYDIGYNLSHYVDSVNGGRVAKSPYLRGSMTSIFWSYFQNNINQKEDNLRANVDLNVNITSWLSLLVRANINSTGVLQENKQRGDLAGFLGGYYSVYQSNLKQMRVQSLLTATRKLTTDLDASLTIGGETNRGLGGYYNSANTNGGFKIADQYSLNNSVNAVSASGNRYGVQRLDAIYAYGDFTWRDMLTLNFSVRNDQNSTLLYADGHGDYSYFYPSVGLSWIFSEALKNKSGLDFLSFGKLRASLGYTGSGPAVYKTSEGFGYSNQGNYTDANGNAIANYGFANYSLGNLNLKPQKAREFEVGTELRFLNNRIGIDVAVYKKNTFNEVINLSTPAESGVNSVVINAGNVENKGIEIALTGSPVRAKNLQWNTTINFARNRNKIIDLDKANGVTSQDLDLAFGADVKSVARVGRDFGTIISTYAFAYQDDKGQSGYGQKLLKQDGTYWRSGDIGQGAKELGSMMEKFIASNINEVRYKNFNLFVQVDAKIGGKMASATHQYGSEYGSFKSTLYGRDAAHGGVQWTDDNGVVRNDGIIPEGVFAAGTSINGTDVSGKTYAEVVGLGLKKPLAAWEYYEGIASWATGIREYSIFENSWVSLREVSIGYTLPQTLSSKIKVNNLRVSLIGRNLAYLYNTAKDHINPESIFSSRPGAFAEYGGMPYVRSYGFSVNAGF